MIDRRTPLKPGAALKRKTALASGGTPKKRKPRLKPKRRTPAPTRGELKALCDGLFSKVVRARGTCEAGGWRLKRPEAEDPALAGFTGPKEELTDRLRQEGEVENASCLGSRRLQCAHVISRAYMAIRWDRRNAVCLCAACHTYFTRHPLEWQIWVEEKLGLQLYLTLRELALAGALKTV